MVIGRTKPPGVTSEQALSMSVATHFAGGLGASTCGPVVEGSTRAESSGSAADRSPYQPARQPPSDRESAGAAKSGDTGSTDRRVRRHAHLTEIMLSLAGISAGMAGMGWPGDEQHRGSSSTDA